MVPNYKNSGYLLIIFLLFFLCSSQPPIYINKCNHNNKVKLYYHSLVIHYKLYGKMNSLNCALVAFQAFYRPPSPNAINFSPKL